VAFTNLSGSRNFGEKERYTVITPALSESQLRKKNNQDTFNLRDNKGEVRGTFQPGTGHEGPEGE